MFAAAPASFRLLLVAEAYFRSFSHEFSELYDQVI